MSECLHIVRIAAHYNLGDEKSSYPACGLVCMCVKCGKFYDNICPDIDNNSQYTAMLECNKDNTFPWPS